MAISSNPPDTSVSEDTARDLITQIARVARAVENYNLQAKERERRDKLEVDSYGAPSIHYPTIDPPRYPRNLSWHEKVREKKVSLPAATGLGLLGYLIIEVGQALIAGRIHLW
jgi:hypothetical protein